MEGFLAGREAALRKPVVQPRPKNDSKADEVVRNVSPGRDGEVVWTRRYRRREKVNIEAFRQGGVRPYERSRSPGLRGDPPPEEKAGAIGGTQTNKLFSAGTERLKRLDALSDLLGTSGKQLGMNREWSARPTAQSLRGQARSLNRDGAIGLEDSFKDSTGLARPPSLGDRSLGDVIREAPFGPPAPSSQPPPEHTAIATARASRSAHAPRQRDAARDMSAAGLMMTAQTLAMKLQTPVHAADPHPPAGPLTPVQAPRRSRHHSTNPDSAPRGYPLDVGEVGIAEPERLPPPSRFANAATAHPIPSAGPRRPDHSAPIGQARRDSADPSGLGPMRLEVLAPETGKALRDMGDVIDYYLSHGNQAQIKIFYLNPASFPEDRFFDPYSAYLVDQSHVAPKHYTVSIQGVVQVMQGGEAVFTSLGDFIREKSTFKMLRTIKFFKQYHQRKFFHLWRSMVRWNLFRRTRAKIGQRLFLVKPAFQDTVMVLLEARTLLEDSRMLVGDYKDVHGETPKLYSVDDFVRTNTKQRTDAMEEIKQISEKIGRTLEDAGKHIKELEGKARDQVDIDKKSLRKEDKLSISQAKAQRQERHRKHMQTKDDVALMPSLIKLADLIICESIIASLLSSGEAMLRLLRSQEWRSASVYKGVFETSVDFHGKNVVVVPESATVVDAIGDVCEAAVTSLYSMPRVYGTSVYRYLLPFLVTDDDPEPERECIDPAAIVEGSVVWRGCLESMGEVVQSSFTMAEEQTRRLESKLAMHEFIQRMEEDGEAMIDELLHPHGTPDPENLAVQMRQLKSWMRGMETVKKVAVCGALSVDMRGIKNYLISKSKEIYGRMLQALKDIARAMLNAVRQEMDGRLKSLTARPKMLEDFVHFHRSFAETLSRRQELVEQVDAVDSVYELVSLASSEEAVPDSDQADRRGLAIVQEQILVEIERAEAFLSAQRGPMLQALEARKQVVDQELLNIVMQLNTGKYSDPNQAANEICEALVKLESQLASLEEESMRLYNFAEELAPGSARDDQNLEQAGRDLQMRVRIWDWMRLFREKRMEWQLSAVTSLHLDDIQDNLDELVREAYKMTKLYKDDAVASRLAKEIDDFKETQPLLELAANKALQNRHWEKIFQLVGRELPKDEDGVPSIRDLSLDDLRSLGLGNAEVLKKADQIQAVAVKEAGVQQALKRMQQELQERELTVLRYKDKEGAYKLGSMEEVQTALDEQVMTVQTIVASPFSSSFKPEARRWEHHLLVLQDLLDTWMKVQVRWLYLEPIFQSQDIMAQLPETTTQFLSVDTTFQVIMHSTHDDPCAPFRLENTIVNQERLEQLHRSLGHLEEVHKALSSYLDAKRLLFPRFFFLSDDEMLEILSKVRDPTRVEPHLRKSFEGIAKLNFEGKARDPAITGMASAEGERIPFVTTVYPRESGGNVEKWLLKVEHSMFEATKAITNQAMVDFKGGRSAEWILRWPQMSVLSVSALFWTRAVEEAIEGRQLSRLVQQCQEDVIELVRGVRGELNELARLSLSTLLVQDVHARDVAEHLLEEGVESLTDFEWRCQLRTYYEAAASASRWGALGHKKLSEMRFEPRTPLASARARNDSLGLDIPAGTPKKTPIQRRPSALTRSASRHMRDVSASSQPSHGAESEFVQDGMALCLRMMDARVEYGYEYQGNSTRLVITPLTDRCYRTLTMSYQLHLGGAPEGPAGTGKTETTKDLAKAVARHCWVYNCSEDLDYLSLGKLLKGLCATGAWACFDEFNRINLEVLSVAAQLIATIQMAVAARVFTLEFEGTNLQLKHTAWVGVTMNPSYAGRNELPDNLKGRFRSVAMMVPDYAMIAEIMLFSEGYVSARECAQKIVQCYKLCSEQLSSQDHYDYGMRAVIAVLRAAGNLKRRHPSDGEFKLILRSLLDVNLCKFVAADIPLFHGIIADLFPDNSRPLMSDYSNLRWALREACLALGLQPSPYFLTKCIQLYEMVAVRHGLMLVGQPLSGKSRTYHALAHALTLLSEHGQEDEHPVHFAVMNPKSMPIGRLFGKFDVNSHEWQDGVLAEAFREAARHYPETEDRQWIVMDGPVDAIWIENMNTVLDDNKKLCLNSGEIIRMSPGMTMLFEVMDVARASPATISRCGMVYTDPDTLGWQPLVLSWLEKFSDGLPAMEDEQKALLLGLINNYMPVTLAFIAREIRTFVPTSACSLVHSFLKMFAALSGYMRDASWWEKNAHRVDVHIQHLFVHALIWSIGAVCSTETDRMLFTSFLRALLYSELKSFRAPSGAAYEDGMESGNLEDWRSVLVPISQNDAGHVVSSLMRAPSMSPHQAQRSLASSPSRGMDILNTAQFKQGESRNLRRNPSRISADVIRRELGGATSVPLSRQASRAGMGSTEPSESVLESNPSVAHLWKAVGKRVGVGQKEAEVAMRRQSAMIAGGIDDSATALARKEMAKDPEKHINLIIAEEAFRDAFDRSTRRASTADAPGSLSRAISTRASISRRGFNRQASVIEVIAEEEDGEFGLGADDSVLGVSQELPTLADAEGSLVAAEQGYMAAEEAWLALLGTPQALGVKITVDTLPKTPVPGTAFDWYFEPKSMEWRQYSKMKFEELPSKSGIFRELLVPTAEHAQYVAMLDTCVEASVPLIFVGPTGAGKTAYVLQHLGQLSDDRFTPPNIVTFTARTTSDRAQSIIEGKLDRRRRGVLGPPLGKRTVLFVDDLNMPQPEEFGAQPPLEMLRTLLDLGGLHSQDRAFYQITDQVVVAAMGPTGGGRHKVSERLLRHFLVAAIPEMTAATMQHVFEAKLNTHLADADAPQELLQLVPRIVSATMRVFESACGSLMPTPRKSHYVFSARDVARVIEGMTLADPLSVDGTAFTRLWAHECLRVFGDRLVDPSDTEWLAQKVLQVLQEVYQVPPEAVFSAFVQATGRTARDALGELVFSDLTTELEGGGGAGIGTERVKPYGEMGSMEEGIGALVQGLAEYNSIERKPLRLTVFQYAVQHVTRIMRVLRVPGEHLMLVGMGGTGRASLTRVGSFLAHHAVVEVEAGRLYSLHDWKEDVRRAMTLAGVQSKKTVFLISDRHLKFPEQVEHVSALLQTADVPGMFASDEKSQMTDAMRTIMEQADQVPARSNTLNTARMVETLERGAEPTTLEQWSMLVSRCRRNLHVVLCLSPDSDAFRERIRMFPALLSCSVVDWFMDWPDEALHAVASFELATVDDLSDHKGEERALEDLHDKVIEVCKRLHSSTRRLSSRFLQQRGRHNAVTPKMFLSLFSCFKKLVEERGRRLTEQYQRFRDGLSQLEGAQVQIGSLQEELKQLKPKLEEATEQARLKLEQVEAEQSKVEEYRRLVDAELARANDTAAAANAIRLECEARLQEALPAMEAAIKALDTIDPKDMRIVQSFKSPPEPIKLVLQAVMALLRIDPLVMPHPTEYGKKIVDFWTPALRMLQDPHLLDKLKSYEKDNIEAKIMDKVKREYISREDFKVDRVAKASEAMAGICKWVLALAGYDQVAKEIAPKKEDLARADEEYRQTMLVVKAKQEEVDKLLRQLSELRAQAEALEGKKASLAREIEACTLKIGRAERLIEGLGDEQQRWGKEAEVLSERKDNVIGDMLLCAGVVNYLGAFTKDFRDDALIEWEELMTSVGLNYSRPESGCFSIVPHLSDPVTVLTWHLEGLPNDPLSVENAIIVHEAVRAPLMVDPVGQATRWLTSMFKKGNLQTLKAQERDLMRKIENAVQFGLPVIIQEVAESLDAALDPVLSKQVFTQSGVTYVRMGDANIEWNDKFRLFLSCPLSNPHFLPDTAAKVTQINFAITEQGLGDQLLGIMLSEERPLVAEQHRELTLQRAANAKRLQDLEDQILRVVSTERKGTEEGAGGSILDDEAAISIVQESKRLSAEIVEKNKGIALAQEKLDEARDAFHGTGLYAAMLFFCVQDLHALDPMYLFSLDWFVSAFVSSIRSAPRSDDMAVRLEGIRSELLWNIFEAVCMGLFARDKLTFAAIIALKVIQRHEGSDTAPAATPEQIRYLLTGGQSVAKHPREAEPPRAGVSSAVWVRCCRLSAVLPRLEKLPDAIAEDPASWSAALEAMTEACSELPKGFLDGAAPLTVWERLLVVRALRPDLTVRATRVLVGDILGDRFAEPPPMDMQHVFAHSSATRPMLFLLAPGLDPIQSVWQYAERMGIKKRVVSVSLGQGQGAKAEKVLVPGARDGDWVVLQNAHLSPSWLPWLERFVRSLQADETNSQFRLIITSMPTRDMSLNLLRDALKICNEPQQGMKANMLRTVHMDAMRQAGLWPPETGEGESGSQAQVHATAFARFVYSLCYLHATVKERASYGPPGWSVPYSFSDSDFTISLTQIHNLLAAAGPSGPAPFAALKYTVGEIIYGGRVTDDKDRRLLSTLLDRIFAPETLDDKPRPLLFDESPFQAPHGNRLSDIVAAVEGLPGTVGPECIGLHRNADITKDIAEANKLLEDLSSSITGSTARQQSDLRQEEELVRRFCTDMTQRLPQDLNAAKAHEKYPPDYTQSMNQVVIQEIARYNRLLAVVRTSLNDLTKALDGLLAMSQELDDVFRAFVAGAVPSTWKMACYPTLKPLAGFFDSLLRRIAMFDSWIKDRPPVVYWLPGFFFTHSFLTAIRQNYARKHRVPIDTVEYRHTMQQPYDLVAVEKMRRPADGAYVYGLFLEGAIWDGNAGTLAEPRPRELYCEAPIIFMKPVADASSMEDMGTYECPVYRTTERRGTLTTTGHSSNFIMSMGIPSALPGSHWTLRGACMTLERDE